MPRDDQASQLAAAAEAVEAELQRFEAASAAFEKLALNSQKNLERATRALDELAGGEQRIIEKVQALVASIGTVRDRQMAQVEPIRAKAEALKARTVIFQALEQDLRSLGEAASELSAKLKQTQEAAPPPELEAELGELATKAKDLAERAKREDFDDLSRVADGLRQQLLALRAKLKLIVKPTASA